MENTKTKSVFETLSAINVNSHTEKKGNLTYLSWAWAWGIAKRYFPDASYTIYESSDGWPYFTDGRTCWVKTGVTIEGLEHVEYLPVMDYRNNSIPAPKVTSMDVNKTIQRSLTKALARHGLGLYIYAGEDLPEPAPITAVKPQEPAGAVEELSDGLLTAAHLQTAQNAMREFEEDYESLMGTPLYREVLNRLGVQRFKSLPDMKFPALMQAISSCRAAVRVAEEEA